MKDLWEIGKELHLGFRKSVAGDEAIIDGLIHKRFGSRASYKPLDNIEGRYLMAINDAGEVVAITGLNYSEYYNGPEIDWTCVDSRYTGHRLISSMIAELIKDCEEDVYCSCWRLNGKTINMRSAMQDNGFVPVLIPRVSFSSDLFAICKRDCINYNPENGVCTCCEDLYVRRKKQ